MTYSCPLKLGIILKIRWLDAQILKVEFGLYVFYSDIDNFIKTNKHPAMQDKVMLGYVSR